MPTAHKMRRTSLRDYERVLIRRMEKGEQPWSTEPPNEQKRQFRHKLMCDLEEQGFVYCKNGLWYLTDEACETGPNSNWYSAHENNVIRKYYKSLGPTVLAERFNRTPRGIAMHASKLGVTSYQPHKDWEPHEEELMRKHYPTSGSHDLKKLLPHYSRLAIRSKAVRMGLKTKYRWWLHQKSGELRKVPR